MLWKVFLVTAVMLACCGPVASGLLGQLGKSMLDDWFNGKYLPITLPPELQAFLNETMSRYLLPRTPGIRKECRNLSDDERGRLFTCFKGLANSGKMLAFEAVHRSQVAVNAHGGACFISWHRVFLELVELALQQFCDDSSITLCWWDVGLDIQLPKPCESAIFTSTYFGNENGQVTTGPYAYKECTFDCLLLNSALFRQCGQYKLPSLADIDAIVNAYNYTVMATPDANNGGLSMVEGTHGWPHMFVGGQMSYITCSPGDFIFFLYHTFMDKLVYDNFKRRGGNIDNEYPQGSNIPPEHSANAPIVPFPVRTCIEALRPHPEDAIYTARAIQCSDHDACGSKALWCNNGRCIACVRGGAKMTAGWPNRACYIEACANPVSANGVCACGAV